MSQELVTTTSFDKIILNRDVMEFLSILVQKNVFEAMNYAWTKKYDVLKNLCSAMLKTTTPYKVLPPPEVFASLRPYEQVLPLVAQVLTGRIGGFQQLPACLKALPDSNEKKILITLINVMVDCEVFVIEINNGILRSFATVLKEDLKNRYDENIHSFTRELELRSDFTIENCNFVDNKMILNLCCKGAKYSLELVAQ